VGFDAKGPKRNHWGLKKAHCATGGERRIDPCGRFTANGAGGAPRWGGGRLATDSTRVKECAGAGVLKKTWWEAPPIGQRTFHKGQGG